MDGALNAFAGAMTGVIKVLLAMFFGLLVCGIILTIFGTKLLRKDKKTCGFIFTVIGVIMLFIVAMWSIMGFVYA